MIDEIFGRRFFAMYDADPKAHSLIEITDVHDLDKKNQDGFGIFWTVNKIKAGLPRKKENLEKILAIAFEIDSDSKDQQAKKIKSTITPSMIIETKRGYHNYFFIEDFEPDADAYIEFILDRIAPYYNADKNAADATRILRVPGFYHWKDKDDPFVVRCAKIDERMIYKKSQLEKFFPIVSSKEVEKRNNFKNELKFQKDSDLFLKIWQSHQGTILKKLSQTEAVGMERIDFKNNRNGSYL